MKICIANIMKSDATNQIRYRKFLVRKQTIIKFFLCCKSEKFDRTKGRKSSKIIESRNLWWAKQLRKKGSSIYALRNNNNKRDNKMLLIFRDFVARIHADSFVEGSTGVARFTFPFKMQSILQHSYSCGYI